MKESDKDKMLLDSGGGFALLSIEGDGHRMVTTHRTGTGFGTAIVIDDDGVESEESVEIYILGLKTADGGEHEFMFLEEQILDIALEIVDWQLRRNQAKDG